MTNEKYEWIDKSEFDKFANAGKFTEGPFRDSFGDGDGEPYLPNRRLWGTLDDGRRVESNTTNERPTSSTNRG